MSGAKLALLTTRPPPLYPSHHSAHTHTHTSQCHEWHACFQQSGCGWRLRGADHSLGADQLFLLLLTVWLGVSVTHSNGSDKTVCWHVRAAEISLDFPVSRFFCVCPCIMSSLNVLAEQNQSSIHLDYIRGGTNLRQWHFQTWMYNAASVEWIGPWNVMMSYFQDRFPLYCMIAYDFMQWKFKPCGIFPWSKSRAILHFANDWD